MEYLYRGMSLSMFEKLDGKLQPKSIGESFSSVPCAGDPHAVCGSGIVAGDASINSVVYHQWNQLGLPISGVSFTPFIDRAKFYALSGGKNAEGYIFKVSVKMLSEASVLTYKVNDLIPHPAIPEDDEHILVAKDFHEIPEKVIVSISKVTHGI
jgi:hypothetical protein